ncbi:MAG: hypothetical protein U1E89_19010 [Burkholderiaceae bacterium]
MHVLALKLALVAASVLGASLVSRRWGHAAGGLMAGLPMIIGPITAILLIDNPADRVRAIALATLQCQPAMLMHVLVFARAARRWSWPPCLLAANAVYLVAAAALAAWALPPLAAAALALGAWWFTGRAIAADAAGPRRHSGPVSVPRSELWWRLAVALAVAGAVIEAAASAPAAVGGVLLAAPITGNVLPAFTLPRHGPGATARLLAGFVHGQIGFMAFVAGLVAWLPLLHPALAFTLAVAGAVAAPWLLDRLQRRARQQG